MNWRDYICSVYAVRTNASGTKSKPEFRPAASAQEVAELESQLRITLPAELRSLLLESNGVMDMLAVDDGEYFENCWLIEPIGEIIVRNRGMRCDYSEGSYEAYWCNRKMHYERSFEELLFFASAGVDGILFAHAVNRDRVAEPSIVAWEPIRDELTPIALSLGDFIAGWLTDQIKV